jgi:hypothetical protein
VKDEFIFCPLLFFKLRSKALANVLKTFSPEVLELVPDPNDGPLMSDHAGGQADGRSRRGACQIGGQKGRHIANFF